MLKDVYQLTPELLEKMQIEALFFDVDNTIVTYNNHDYGEELINFFKNMQDSGVLCCIISNNSAERIKPLADDLGILFIERAKKPLTSGFKRGLDLVKLDKSKVMMVGDQIFTDTLGAKMAGLKVCKVVPICTDFEFAGTKINRMLEKIVLPYSRKKCSMRLDD